MAYLDPAGYTALAIAPEELIEQLPNGWLAARLGYWSAWIDSRLAKRYRVPFEAPYPVAVIGWLERLVTHDVYLRRGVDPLDQQVTAILGAADAARAEVQQAADAVDGLYELPLRADTSGSGISKGSPLAYSEVSPYSWMTEQMEELRSGGR